MTDILMPHQIPTLTKTYDHTRMFDAKNTNSFKLFCKMDYVIVVYCPLSRMWLQQISVYKKVANREILNVMRYGSPSTILCYFLPD